MPILRENSFEFISRSPEQTKRIGARLGSGLKKGDVICLYGELGAGKTTLVQGLVQGWGSAELVTSPTFVLINEYRRPDNAEIHHLDAYRLKDEGEAEVLDVNELIEQGILLVEWPERIQKILPADHLWIEMYWIADEQRRMVFLPHGDRNMELAANLRQQIYKEPL
jgi:tRNA threonylcarbamoyladenosine biosynthesis protein TsaE